MRALLCIGKLIRLDVNDGNMIRLRNRWLAWDGKAFHICTVRGTTQTKLPGRLVAKHRKFHDAPPQGKPFIADCPSPQGGTTKVGLLKALVYTVPRKIHSPEKNPYQWHHAFGDTGHKGGDDYPEKVMPLLVKDSKGNFFIKRRPGNIFRVDQWLRG